MTVRLSFLVPAHNEELWIGKCLDGIRTTMERIGEPFEVIVVDDASSDSTNDMAERVGVRTFRIERRKISAVHNAGAAVDRGRLSAISEPSPVPISDLDSSAPFATLPATTPRSLIMAINELHPDSERDPRAPAWLSRRHFLSNSAVGLGGVALAWLLNRDQARAAGTRAVGSARQPHFAPKAKRIVQIYCCGGVSHLDTFDYKPELERLHGKTLEGKGENLGFFGQPGKVMKSVYDFRQHGQSGGWVSSLLPHLAGCVDDVCFIHSMFAKSNNHTPATFQMNSGFTLNGFPSMGAWLSYGLGTENENLPAFVVLPDPRGLMAGGSINWTSGFLPANHQGVPFRTNSREPIVDLNTPSNITAAARFADMDLLASMNREFAEAHPGDDAFAARLRSYELAARMQSSIPEATNLDNESDATKKLYGLDEESNKGFSRNCLMARRLLERGVRFVQIFNGGSFGSPRINWDGHENLKQNHDTQAATMDKPVAALIHDLKQRGMLEDTLFVWATEFGRSPSTQGINSPGRDHHPTAFTCFLAGAGVKKGFHYGKSDEVGYFVAENKVTIPDFHATILHLLGIEHEKLTFYHNGIDRRLTDVHGKVIEGVLS